MGKERESTHYTSEEYKKAVRKYMESIGYAQTYDSKYEGTLADMCFIPLTDQASSYEIWVECKATKLSISDSQFMNELFSYFSAWSHRTHSMRFQFKIFIKQLMNVKRWESIFGIRMNHDDIEQYILKWKDTINSKDTSFQCDNSDIESFFSEIDIIEADSHTLYEIAQQRTDSESAFMEVRMQAKQHLKKMKERSKPLLKKSKIITNLLQFQPPTKYDTFSIKYTSLEQIIDSMKGIQSPPYVYLGKSRILAIHHLDNDDFFSTLNPEIEGLYSLDEIQTEYPNEFRKLINFSLNSYLRRRGIAKYKKWYYFIARKEAIKLLPRKIRTKGNQRITVVKPMKITSTHDVQVSQQLLNISDDTNSNDKVSSISADSELNFMFHEGFTARYLQIWGQHFININLHRIYTNDGINVIEGDSASRIDRGFRRPNLNRPDIISNKIKKISESIFKDSTSLFNSTDWSYNFKFGKLLTVSTDWSPDQTATDQLPITTFSLEDIISDGEEYDDF
jgi:hypothetical protein